MDFSLFLNIVAAAIGFFLILRKLRSHQENKEFDSTSLSPPSSLSLSTSSTPSSSSASPSLVWMYDVFPSFRGEDVRDNFLSHIKKEFERKTVTFFNDNGIERGESVAPELIRGIRGSKIAIVSLSRNYASSKWCLEELVEIMKCREELGQTVIAIFYKVDPSDVKKLTGYFGKVFRNTCKGKAKEDIRRWKQALEKVATIAGYHSCNWVDEAAMIEDISTDVFIMLNKSTQSSHFDNLIGMSTHMENLELLLSLGSNEVRMIGFWGPSGIGKSTIARVLFSQYHREFQYSVFMENIKRLCPRPYYDEYSVKLQLQKEFLSRIMSQKDIKIQHLGVVQDRLYDKRVLAILDDVDHSSQIDAIAKEARWFGPGSRIIITTQDKRLLNAHGINHIYEVQFPPYNEALEIFCMYAFGQKSPHDGFKELAWKVTNLAGKLPLGLKVMGSYFKGRPKHEWEEDLPRLRTRLDGEIENILKFSYDALCDEDQALFLHLACFFNHAQIKRVEEYLAKNFVGVKGHLRVLAEKSFISVDGGYIKIHDLLARLGREIVRKQSIHEPGKRQFLVDAGDICRVLRNDTLGSGSVIGINLDGIELESESKINDRAFERMSSVQFLRVTYTSFSQCPHYIDRVTFLPPNLSVLEWEHFPMSCLPSKFNPEFLVEINMRRSNVEKLWEGNKAIRNLKWMDLSDSINLKELPDLSTATNLKELDLSNCSSLVELPFSIGNAINLIYLNLRDCSSLMGIPSSVWDCVNLGKLDLSHCSSLVRLPSSFGDAKIKLKVLKLHGCTSLMELPSSMENATNLEKLDLRGCLHLAKLPSSIGNLRKLYLEYCSSLVELPSSVINALNLKDFTFNGCSSLVELPSFLGNATNLEILDLRGCSSLRRLPIYIGNMTSLFLLHLGGCSSLRELPFSIGNMINLEKLVLKNCSSLVELPSSFGNMTNLETLKLDGCSNLLELPSSFGNMTNLETLKLDGCSNLLELPSSFGNMTYLHSLSLHQCSSLRQLPYSIGNMTSVYGLYLSGCSSLVELPSSIGNMTNVGEFILDGCSSLRELPSSIGNMTNLKKLDLRGCSSLVELPSSIGNMTNLYILSLQGCSKLKCLPININMKSLGILNLTDCSSIKRFPEVSTNIEDLNLIGTAIEEIPPSIMSWPRLHELRMSYFENIRKSQHALDLITELSFSDTRIQEIPPWVKEMSRLSKIVIKGCTKLVSLPQLPDSVKILDAENCKSLERLDCSSYKTKFHELRFINCFKLNQEVRDLLIRTSTRRLVFPSETVPTYFSSRAIGKSLKWNGLDICFPTSLRFKACVLMVNKDDDDAFYHGETPRIYFFVKYKLTVTTSYCELESQFWHNLSPTAGEHLFVFEIEETVSVPELVFEFKYNKKDWEIKECGLHPLETLAP